MKRRIISLMLAVTVFWGVLAGLAPKADALHQWIKDRSVLSGSDYTESDKMAQKLDEIFDGSISVYSNSGCTTAVNAKIGTSVMKNNGVAMYAGPYGGPAVNNGTSCWIYAQGVYYTLFEDYVLNGKGKYNSETIDTSTTATTNCTYENFKAWGVRQGVGAMLRASNHSMILLGYDEETITTLEGNADGAGLVCVRVRSWDQVNTKYSSFTFIVQPTDEYMQDNYDACRHENFSSVGECPDCGYVYNWERSFDSTAAGYYTINATCVPKVSAPYAAAESSTAVLATGDMAQVLGSVVNYFGETWYQLCLEDGSTAYAPGEVLEFAEHLPLEVSCTKFTPADGLALKAESYPLSGIVTSNYPLKKIDAYLNGEWYAAWTASDETTTQVSLNPTDINMDLSFSKLAEGKYIITMAATDYIHEEPVTFHRSAFYIVGDDECLHSYTSSVTTAPTCTVEGEQTYVCSLCGDSYTEAIAAPGHSYSYGYCTVCGSLDFDYAFTTARLQVGTVEGEPGQSLSVPVTIENNQCFASFTFTVSYDTAAITFDSASAGELLQGGTFTQSGSSVSWSGNQNIIGDGTLFYLNFTLAEDAVFGSYEIKAALKSNSTYYFRDENNNARDLELNPGAVVCVEQAPVCVYQAGEKVGSYSSVEQALGSFDSTSQYLKLNKDQTVSVTLAQDLYIDLNGFDMAGTVNTGAYKVWGMDSATDEYSSAAIGYFSCTDENGEALIPEPIVQRDQKRYATLETEEGYSFHRFYLGITHTTVKPSTEGVGYKAVFAADDMLAAEIDSYGFTLQLVGNDPVSVNKAGADFVSLETVTLRVDGYDVEKWGEAALSAQVFVVINGQRVDSVSCTYTLRQILETVNSNADSLTEAQKTALHTWIENNPVMQSWDVDNIYSLALG